MFIYIYIYIYIYISLYVVFRAPNRLNQCCAAVHPKCTNHFVCFQGAKSIESNVVGSSSPFCVSHFGHCGENCMQVCMTVHECICMYVYVCVCIYIYMHKS